MYIKLDRLIILQHRTETQDQFGQPIETWAPLPEQVWANKRDLSGRERFIAEHTQAVRAAIYTIRYRPYLIVIGAAADYRIEYEGWIWDIEGIAEPRDSRSQYLELTSIAVGS